MALTLGLLIGLERGWQEGSRVAGSRTFGLIGLLGTLWQFLVAALGGRRIAQSVAWPMAGSILIGILWQLRFAL